MKRINLLCFILIKMKIVLFQCVILFSSINMLAQNHSVNIRLLKADVSAQFASSLHCYSSFFEYDSEKRVSKIEYADGSIATIEYGNNQIVATISETDFFFGTTYSIWTMDIENNHIVKDVLTRNGETYEIYLYSYDSQDQLVRVERQVPVEPDRAMTFDIEWTDGHPTLCSETWLNGKYAATHEYTYTSIEDQTLANFYVTPFNYMDNLKDKLLPLFYCHNYYGKRHKYLPQGHKQTYSIYKGNTTTKEGWENTFDYQKDSKGRISQISDGEGKTVTLFWDETDTAVKTIIAEDTKSSDIYSLDGRLLKKPSKGINIIDGKKALKK